jgi:hypothetical protein
MIERIFRNWKTTVFGIVLILFGGILVWFEKASLAEFSAFLMGGFALMMSRDEKKYKHTNKPDKGS